jgi:hypothetical protein
VVVVDRSAGLRVFTSSATDPLEEVGLLPELETSEELASSGDLVVAVTGSFLYVVDISDPASPRRIGPRLPGRPAQVAMSGSYAFSHDSTEAAESLRVVDLREPSEPTIAAELPLTDIDGNAMVFLSDLAVHGSLLLAVGETEPDACNPYGDWWEGAYELVTIDITDPARPRLLGSVDLGCYWVSSIAPAGRWAYAVHPFPNGTDFEVVDLTHPSAPRLVAASSDALPGDSWYLAAAGGRLLVGQRDEGSSVQHVYELTDPLHPVHVGSIAASGLVFGPAIEGKRAFVPYGESGLVVLDLEACPADGPPAPRHPSRRIRMLTQHPLLQ